MHLSTTTVSYRVFTVLKIPCVPCIQPYFSPSEPVAITDLFTVCVVLPFPEYHINRIIEYVVFSDLLSSLSNIHLRFFHIFL